MDEKDEALSPASPTKSMNVKPTVDHMRPKLLVIIPYAMVCSGKSHFWGIVQKYLKDPEMVKKIGLNSNISFATVSSDETRREVMETLKRKKKLSDDKAFE